MANVTINDKTKETAVAEDDSFVKQATGGAAAVNKRVEASDLRNALLLWVGEYSATYTYAADKIVNYSGTLYKSLQASNTGNTPDSSPTYWEAVAGGITTYTTVANAEAASGSDNDLCFVVATETFYRYEADGSAYTDDNLRVLSTNDGGNTRWLAVAGKYTYAFALTPEDAPTTDYQVANKKYVDDNAGGGGGTVLGAAAKSTQITIGTPAAWTAGSAFSLTKDSGDHTVSTPDVVIEGRADARATFVEAALDFTFTSDSDEITVQWHDGTGYTGSEATYSPRTGTGKTADQPVAKARIAETTTTNMELRIKAISASGGTASHAVTSASSWATVEEVSAASTGSNVVAEHTVSTAEQSKELTFPATQRVMVVVEAENDDALQATFSLYINGDTTAANYHYNRTTSNNGANPTGAEGSDATIVGVNNGDQVSITAEVSTGPVAPTLKIDAARRGTSTAVLQVDQKTTYNGTNPTELTSITVSTDQTDGLGVGTTITVYDPLKAAEGEALTWTDWTISYSPFTTATTENGRYQHKDYTWIADGKLDFSGAPTGTGNVTAETPSGITIAQTVLDGVTDVIGYGTINDSSDKPIPIDVIAVDADTIGFRYHRSETASSPVERVTVTDALPITFASGDSIAFRVNCETVEAGDAGAGAGVDVKSPFTSGARTTSISANYTADNDDNDSVLEVSGHTGDITITLDDSASDVGTVVTVRVDPDTTAGRKATLDAETGNNIKCRGFSVQTWPLFPGDNMTLEKTATGEWDCLVAELTPVIVEATSNAGQVCTPTTDLQYEDETEDTHNAWATDTFTMPRPGVAITSARVATTSSAQSAVDLFLGGTRTAVGTSSSGVGYVSEVSNSTRLETGGELTWRISASQTRTTDAIANTIDILVI